MKDSRIHSGDKTDKFRSKRQMLDKQDILDCRKCKAPMILLWESDTDTEEETDPDVIRRYRNENAVSINSLGHALQLVGLIEK